MGGVSMEWKEVRLGDVCSKIGSGATPSGGKEAYKGGDYHLIRSQNVLDFAFSKDGLASINDEQANKLKNVEIIQGDVLLNITGDSVARCCIVPSEILPARVNQHVAIIRPRKEELDNNYLLYYLQYYKRQLLQLASAGATRNAITKAMIENLILPCPKSLEDQRCIASILSSLDRKIELNNKINANLEEMAQAIFKNWFVDFEPFKDGKFVDSELGMIPEGWKVGCLGDMGAVVCGKTPSKANSNYYRGDIPFIKIPDMHGNVFVENSEDRLTEEGSLSQIKKLIPPYSLMVSCIATVGLVSINTKPSHTNQQINTVIPHNKSALFYLYQHIKNNEELLKNMGRGGTTTLNVNTKSFSNIRLLIPTETTLERFNEIVEGLFKKIELNMQESRTLSLLRDTLLPRLMSGEIEIPE